MDIRREALTLKKEVIVKRATNLDRIARVQFQREKLLINSYMREHFQMVYIEINSKLYILKGYC